MCELRSSFGDRKKGKPALCCLGCPGLLRLPLHFNLDRRAHCSACPHQLLSETTVARRTVVRVVLLWLRSCHKTQSWFAGIHAYVALAGDHEANGIVEELATGAHAFVHAAMPALVLGARAAGIPPMPVVCGSGGDRKTLVIR